MGSDGNGGGILVMLEGGVREVAAMMVVTGMLNRVRRGELRCWVWGEISWRESCLKGGGEI